MKPETEIEFLKELKKMNGFLEAIDWKLWNLHKKYAEGGNVVVAKEPEEVEIPVTITATTATTKPSSVASSADVAVPTIPKYPSIEKRS